MTDEKRLTTAERLEMHNLVALVKSARSKQAQGKTLTKSEIAAVAELERRRDDRQSTVATRGPLVSAGPVVRALMKFASTADEVLIRGVLGEATATSIPQVAEIFDVSQATVRNGWRRDGMPGEVRRGPGQRSSFGLADIVIWCLRREEAAIAGRIRGSAHGHQRTDAAREELAAIELATARASLRIKEMRIAEITGDLGSITQMRFDWNCALRVLSQEVLDLTRDVTPGLCAKCAKNAGEQMDRRLRNGLHRISEMPASAMTHRTSEPDEQ